MATDVLCQRHCTDQVKYKYNTPLFELQLPMLSLCGYIQIALSRFLINVSWHYLLVQAGNLRWGFQLSSDLIDVASLHCNFYLFSFCSPLSAEALTGSFAKVPLPGKLLGSTCKVQHERKPSAQEQNKPGSETVNLLRFLTAARTNN